MNKMAGLQRAFLWLVQQLHRLQELVAQLGIDHSWEWIKRYGNGWELMAHLSISKRFALGVGLSAESRLLDASLQAGPVTASLMYYKL